MGKGEKWVRRREGEGRGYDPLHNLSMLAGLLNTN